MKEVNNAEYNNSGEKYIKVRYSFFKWRCSLSLVNKIALALGMAYLTGLMAQIKISLP